MGYVATTQTLPGGASIHPHTDTATDTDRRARASLFGTAAVAWMLAATKWGAYVQIGPLYAADLLIGFAVAYAVASQTLKGRRTTVADLPLRPLPGWPLALLLLWAAVRLGMDGAPDTITVLRDFVPYLYVGLGLLSALAAYHSTTVTRQRTVRVLWWALLFHLAWMAITLLAPGLTAGLPQLAGGQQVLAAREDIDGAILGITAAFALHRWLANRGTRYLAVCLASAGLTIIIPSRAALLAMIMAVAVVLLVSMTREHRTSRERWLTVAGPVVGVLAVIVIAQSPAGARMLSMVGIENTTAEGYASAQGTTQAREASWDLLIDYVGRHPERRTIGVGFGPNFMLNSGAAYALLGPNAAETGVRSPHNYWLGTYARLGIPGLAFATVVALVVLSRIVRVRKLLGEHDLYLLAAVMAVGLIPTALFGVTFESPFGAVPFYWAAGLLLGVKVSKLRRTLKESSK